MRNYKRKTAAKNPEILKQAVEAVVKQKRPVLKVAKEYGFSPTTLRRLVKRVADKGGKTQTSENIGRIIHDVLLAMRTCRQVFTPAQEKLLVRFIKKRCENVASTTYKQMRTIAVEFAVTNGVELPPSWFMNNMAGVDWLTCFLKRNPEFMTQEGVDLDNNDDHQTEGVESKLNCHSPEVAHKKVPRIKSRKQQEKEKQVVASFLSAVQSLDNDEDKEQPGDYCIGQMQSMYDMYKNKRFCDYTLFVPPASGSGQNVQPAVIRVHRCVFAAASEKINKAQSGIFIVEPDISSKGVHGVVEFAYTGAISNVSNFSAQEMMETCQAAVFLGIDKCARYLVRECPDVLPEVVAMNPLFWNAEFPWVDPV